MSADSSRFSVMSELAGGLAGGLTSVAGGLVGVATVEVSTLRSAGLVAGFFLGQPYRKIKRTAATIQNIFWRVMRVSPLSRSFLGGRSASHHDTSPSYQGGR